jgi:hypothetical protein
LEASTLVSPVRGRDAVTQVMAAASGIYHELEFTQGSVMANRARTWIRGGRSPTGPGRSPSWRLGPRWTRSGSACEAPATCGFHDQMLDRFPDRLNLSPLWYGALGHLG